MEISLNKREFVDSVLNPASKLAENVCLEIAPSRERIKTLVTTADGSTIMLASAPCEASIVSKWIIPDCKSFLRLIQGIDSDSIVLSIEDNFVRYKSPVFTFKYHLLDESFVSAKKAINEEKINSLEFETGFEMPKAKFAEVLRFNSIIPEAEKLYVFTEGSKVHARIGDDQKHNTNEVTLDIADEYSGEGIKSPIPLNIQSLLLMSFAQDFVSVAVNQQLKIFSFESGSTKYVISGLVR